MAFKFSIGIVTYLGRFESYFQPLVRKLHFLFPDYEKNVFINGHYDTVRQFQYLRDVTAFLGHYPDFRYVTNLHHQPLARGWNWLMLMSRCNQVLILNDDISFDLEFRHNLESLRLVDQVFMLNRSWGHFVIDKQVIRRVGWFDERFTGVGDEDIDYVLRLGMTALREVFGEQANTPIRTGLERMSAWARSKGHRTISPFTAIEVERNLPESWARLIPEPKPE